MDEDTSDAAWHQQEQEERRRIEEAWQAMCAACHSAFKAQIEALALGKEKVHGDHGG